MRLIWSAHAEKRLAVLDAAGVSVQDLENLAQLIVEEGREEVAVGVTLQHPVDDPTNRNWTNCNVAGAVVRLCGQDRIVTTMFLSRSSQFDPDRGDKGCQSPEEHFRVERVVLR